MALLNSLLSLIVRYFGIVYYAALFLAGLIGTPILLKLVPAIPEAVNPYTGMMYAGVAGGIVLMFIGYKFKQTVMLIGGRLFGKKSFAQSKAKKKTAFDMSQILGCPDPRQAVGWKEAAEVLYLRYDQMRKSSQWQQMTEPQRTFYLVHHFYTAVTPTPAAPGGLLVFLQHCNEAVALQTVKALQCIEARETAELLLSSIKTDRNSRMEKSKHYLRKVINAENLLFLLLNYVRQHREHFQ